MHRDCYKMEAAFVAQKKAGEDSDYLECPAEFDPRIFDGFKFGKKFMEREATQNMDKG
jgi:hypothetical protein